MEVYTSDRPRAMPELSAPAHKGDEPARSSHSSADEIAHAWDRHAGALAVFTMKNFVNRRDAFGQYIAVECRTDPDRTAITQKSTPTLAILERHYRGESTGDLIGLHSTVRDEPTSSDEVASCWSRWIAVDIDRHDDATDPEVTLKAALALWDRLVELGFRPLLLDSNGRGGYHLIVLFEAPIPTEKAHAFGKWLVRGWRDMGLDQEPEVFPKQPAIGPGGFGNWLRLPGWHHTRDHYTMVWSGEGWLEGARAIKAIVTTTGVSVDLIPDEALVIPGRSRKARAPLRPGDHQNDAAQAIAALAYLDPDMPYPEWLNIGMALEQLGAEGLAIWDNWSSSGQKYDEGLCDRKWRSFGKGTLKLGTLFHMAKARGFEFPKGLKPESNGHAPRPQLAIAPPTNPAEPEKKLASAEMPTFGNHHYQEYTDKDGEAKSRVIAHDVHAIDENLEAITPGWPKRVDDKLFVATESEDPEPVHLNSANRLFAHIDGRARVVWTKGARLVTQERYYQRLTMTAERYDSIELMPHTPPIPGVYYMHRPLPQSEGKLDGLVDFFSPETRADRVLMKALILTLSWGGPPGKRPAFLVTGPTNDPEPERQGRGVGKTTFIDVVSDGLYLGSVEAGSNQDMGDLVTRLLSRDALRYRVIRHDNVKSWKYSDADLEGMITAKTISGRALYQGEGRRSNTLTHLITLNGASLSSDLAERVAMIRLARSNGYQAGWSEAVADFASKHRWQILAEAAEILSRPALPFTKPSRWSEWESAVLSKLDHAEECQRLMLARQSEVNLDASDREIFRDYLCERIKEHGHMPETAVLKIKADDLHAWLVRALGEPVASNKATPIIKGLGIPELRFDTERKFGCRGFIWVGISSTHIDMTLLNTTINTNTTTNTTQRVSYSGRDHAAY